MSSQQTGGQRLVFAPSGSRQVRADAVGRGTLGVSDVRRSLEAQLHVAFPHRVWVSGRVDLRQDDEDGLRFCLLSATDAEPFVLPCWILASGLPDVRSLLLREHDADLEDVVLDGRLARVGGLLRFDGERGVVLLVSELDPTPTALQLDEQREVALDRAAQAPRQDGPAPSAPLSVTVIGPRADAAVHRTAAQLDGSRFAVGAKAVEADPDHLAQAVTRAANDSDVVLLVRSAGRPLGLAAYDRPDVVQAVAQAPAPVLAGLGGRGVKTAVDAVAATTLPTASAVAAWVLDRLDSAEHDLTALSDDITAVGGAAAERCQRVLAESAAAVHTAAEQAGTRSAAARRRTKRWLAAGFLAAVALIVAAAVVADLPLLLALLIVPVLAVAAAFSWWRYRPDRSTDMSGRSEQFTDIVERLGQVRDELEGTSSPERVGALRREAEDLLERGRALLARELQPTAPEVTPADEEPAGRA